MKLKLSLVALSVFCLNAYAEWECNEGNIYKQLNIHMREFELRMEAVKSSNPEHYDELKQRERIKFLQQQSKSLKRSGIIFKETLEELVKNSHGNGGILIDIFSNASKCIDSQQQNVAFALSKEYGD